jgi:anthranilate phosphoribosyltransferase
MKEFLSRIVNGENLSRAESRDVMVKIISGSVEPVQTAAFLVALKTKNESIDEVVGFVQAMREKMVSIKGGENAIDLCGTGGDRKSTFNISTTASFVVSAAGLPVAKHGNRSVSSRCGSADILEKLGAKIDLSTQTAERCLNEIGYTFLFSPNFHPAMKNVAPVRKALGIPTVFNILGPLCNPANVKSQLIGIYDPAKTRLIAEVLKELGHKSALVVHSRDGLDEISPSKPTEGILLSDNSLKGIEINPEEFGIKNKNIKSLFVSNIDESVKMLNAVLKGEKTPALNAVLLNTAAVLYIDKKANSIKQGLSIAADTIDSGKALKKLNDFIKLSNQL